MDDVMAGRWRLTDGMSVTHLENGGWVIADLYRLSVYELDEETGVLIEQALCGGSVPMDSQVLQEAISSGILIDAGGGEALNTDIIESKQ